MNPRITRSREQAPKLEDRYKHSINRCPQAGEEKDAEDSLEHNQSGRSDPKIAGKHGESPTN
jgi:hypothetical protein